VVVVGNVLPSEGYPNDQENKSRLVSTGDERTDERSDRHKQENKRSSGAGY